MRQKQSKLKDKGNNFDGIKRVIVLSMIFLTSITAYAQNGTVNLKLKKADLSKFFKAIEKQSTYKFSYLDIDIRGKESVSVSVKKQSLKSVLANVLSKRDLQYQVMGNKILVTTKNKKQGVQQKTKTVTGTVVDRNKETIIGANVILKGNPSVGASTDFDGNFSLEVPEGAVLLITYIGFTDVEISTKGSAPLNIVLKEDAKALDEVIVIGYTTQKKGLLTGAVVSMNVSEEMRNIPTTSAANLLAGKMSGVNVSTSNGIPGENPRLTIRTGSSWNKQPVTYVIDGVIRGEGDFNNLSPNEIENFTILKDAASAAIYGSRSAGGVVLVTTRRGKVGKPVFNYSYNYGIDTRTENADLTSAVQAGELYNRINGSADPAGWAWSQEELDHYKTVNGGWGYDQLDAVWSNPNNQTHNLSVNGGGERVKYFAGASYVQQQGFMEPLTYDKFNFRLNVTVDVTDDLEFFAGMGLSDNDQGNVVWEGAGSIYQKLLLWQPDQPVYTDDGQYADYGWITNVGAIANGAGGYNKSNFLKPQMVLNLKYNMPFLKGLSAKAAYSQNWSQTIRSEFGTHHDMATLERTGTNRHIVNTTPEGVTGIRQSSFLGKEYLKKTSTWGHDYQLNLQLSYDNVFKDLHRVSGALVFERTESSGASVYGGRENFPYYLTDQFWAASSSRADTYGGGDSDWMNGRVSFVGQLNYSYADKYLLGLSFREDGSMNFHPDQRWGFFPASSLGWVISEESFFNKAVIDNLKIRASVALIGNDAVGGWQWQESYKGNDTGSTYFGTDPKKQLGITYGSVVNKDLTWEKALSYNIGADVHFLSHWHASADYWYKKSYDILGARTASVPTSFSMAMPSENYGEINAQGFDFNIGYRNQLNDFSYYGNLTLSYGWNEVKIKDYAENAQAIDIPIGNPIDRKLGYRFDRIIRTQTELDQFNTDNPGYKIGGLSPELGMMVYKDLGGPEGIPDGIINSWDRVDLIGGNFPIVYGLNLGGEWNGISLDMMFNGRLNEQKSFSSLAGGVEWNRMWSEWYDNSWTPENTDAWLPKRVSNNSSKTYTEQSDFWYEDASFIRLKYITVGYTLPKQLYSGVFDRVKLFFSGNNLFTLSNFSHYDPEIGGGNNSDGIYDPGIGGGFSFPVMRSFNFGVDVVF